MEFTGASDPTASQAVSNFSFRLPNFWPADPSLWLVQVNSQLVMARITSHTSKFHRVVSVLPPEIAAKIRDLILTPPELLERTTSSERLRLQQILSAEEIGDRKPSQLLHHLQQLLRNKTASLDQDLVPELFLQRLPSTVRMVITAAAGLAMTDLAQFADSLMNVASPSISSIGTTSATNDASRTSRLLSKPDRPPIRADCDPISMFSIPVTPPFLVTPAFLISIAASRRAAGCGVQALHNPDVFCPGHQLELEIRLGAGQSSLPVLWTG
ncbi:hypothetical protein HPB49_011038 [Dermacentor silvarum]|uniref:Uncharacterized protein n=1 Tax=Dermacentor silvarum TaxID=543639 RepID=A0ACB8CEW2_DERSI|nr:hypothetical protein HPB49_011038 [Dermacentor silvarum]